MSEGMEHIGSILSRVLKQQGLNQDPVCEDQADELERLRLARGWRHFLDVVERGAA